MTKKDYELIAKVFNKNITDKSTICIKNNVPIVATAMARQFADVLVSTNPLFDKQRFLTACGVTQ